MTGVLRFLFGSEAGRLLLIIGAGAGAFFYLQNQAYDRGFHAAEAKSRELTERAINELADEADQARVRRRLCIDGGGVWSFANSECLEREAQP